jgi:hypothetical protein
VSAKKTKRNGLSDFKKRVNAGMNYAAIALLWFFIRFL